MWLPSSPLTLKHLLHPFRHSCSKYYILPYLWPIRLERELHFRLAFPLRRIWCRGQVMTRAYVHTQAIIDIQIFFSLYLYYKHTGNKEQNKYGLEIQLHWRFNNSYNYHNLTIKQYGPWSALQVASWSRLGEHCVQDEEASGEPHGLPGKGHRYDRTHELQSHRLSRTAPVGHHPLWGFHSIRMIS